MVDAPESLLEERRLLGLDKIDECWDGEWLLRVGYRDARARFRGSKPSQWPCAAIAGSLT